MRLGALGKKGIPAESIRYVKHEMHGRVCIRDLPAPQRKRVLCNPIGVGCDTLDELFARHHVSACNVSAISPFDSAKSSP